jgi:hypothetical protein
MNSISGYTLPKEATLGYICFWMVANPYVTHDRLGALIAKYNLDPGIIGKPPRIVDAFKRACRYSERKGLGIPNSPNTMNFLIRSVRQTKDEVERHIVLEVVDPKGQRLDYYDVASLVFNRASNSLQITKLTLRDPDMADAVQVTIDHFAREFDTAVNTVDPQVIRIMVRKQLDYAYAVPVRRRGSVYFVPIQYSDTTDSLELFFQELGGGCEFNSIPLIDTQKQREMVRSAFDVEVHEQAVQLITRLKESSKGMTDAQWIAYKKEYNELVRRFSEMKTLVAGELTMGSIEMEALQEHLAEALLSNNVH